MPIEYMEHEIMQLEREVALEEYYVDVVEDVGVLDNIERGVNQY